MAAAKLQAVPGLKISGATDSVHARFERGELTVDSYLESLVSQSVAIVERTLPADRIEWLKGMLREQIVSDPVIRERVRKATGRDLQSQ